MNNLTINVQHHICSVRLNSIYRYSILDTSSCLAFDAISMIDFDFDKKNNIAIIRYGILFPSHFWHFYLDHLRFCSSSLHITLHSLSDD